MKTNIFENGNLKLEVKEDNEGITIIFKGKSTEREPGRFLIPILKGCLDKASEDRKSLVMDFRMLEYMNSSTITPIVRLLSTLNKEIPKVQLQYSEKLRWQAINFSALDFITSHDSRIEVKGV